MEIIKEIIKKLPDKKEPKIKNQGANNVMKDKSYCRGYSKALSEVIQILEGLEVGVDIIELSHLLACTDKTKPGAYTPLAMEKAKAISKSDILVLKEKQNDQTCKSVKGNAR